MADENKIDDQPENAVPPEPQPDEQPEKSPEEASEKDISDVPEEMAGSETLIETPDCPCEEAAELPQAEEEEPEPTEPPKELAPEVYAHCRSAVEAMLFSSSGPLTAKKLADPLKSTGIDSRGIRRVIGELNAEYEQLQRGMVIEELAGGFQMMTRPVYAEYVASLQGDSGPSRLSQAALETLAVVAYKQPVTRADVESIRGVQAGPLLRTLLQKQLVKITGRAEVLGRPLLYGTTKQFLEHFGLKSLAELPKVEELPRP